MVLLGHAPPFSLKSRCKSVTMDLHKNSGTSSVATKAMPHRSVAAEANKQAESRGKNL